MTGGLAFKIAWRLLAYPALLFSAFTFMVFWTYVHPKRFISRNRPAGPYQELELRTSDGVRLDAWFLPHKTSTKAVIVCHGYPMDKGDVLGMTEFLAKDFNLLYFDFRATGKSGGYFATGGARETRDIDAAADYLKGRGLGGGIGIFGFSMGAAAALYAANPALKARALEAPYASLHDELDHIFSGFGPVRKPLLVMLRVWGLVLLRFDLYSVNPERTAAELRTPLLLIQGTADAQVPPVNAARIKAAKPDTELWLMEGAGHGEGRYSAPAEYERRVGGFFRANL